MKKRKNPGYARLRELFHYDPELGVFIALTDYWQRTPYSVIDSKHVWIDGHRYRLARLAWLYVHGAMPGHYLRHINGDERDIRIANLTEGRDGPLAPAARGYVRIHPKGEGFQVVHVPGMGRQDEKLGTFETFDAAADAARRLLT